MMRSIAILVVFLVVGSMVGLTGCSSEADGSLSGSLSDVYDTSFEEVRIRLYSSELSVEFVRSDRQVPVRVTVRAEDLDGPGTYEMPAQANVTGQVGSTKMPDALTGEVNLGEFVEEDGARVQGRFTARFQAGEDSVVLSGRFRGPLEIVNDVFEPEVIPRDAGFVDDVDEYLPPPDVGPIGDGDNGEGDPGEGDNGEGDPGEGDNGEGDPGEGDNGEGDPGEGDNGEGDPGEGDNGEGDPGEGDNGEGDPGEGDNGEADPDPEGP